MMLFMDDFCCAPIGDSPLGSQEADDLAQMLKILADPARLRILSILATAGEVCVCDLTDPLDLSQPTVSHHMKQLRTAGFVSSDRRGKWVYYRLEPHVMESVRTALELPAVSA